jgi:hypothetical protein
MMGKPTLGALAASCALGCLVASQAAAAGGTKVCVPTAKEGKPLVTPKAGVCKAGYALTELGAEGKEGPEGKSGFTAEEVALLKSVLPYLKFAASGVGGKPTIQFSGVNVQILSGAGKTNASVNRLPLSPAVTSIRPAAQPPPSAGASRTWQATKGHRSAAAREISPKERTPR